MRCVLSLAVVFAALPLAAAQAPNSITNLRLWADAAQSTVGSGERVASFSPGVGPVMTGFGPTMLKRGVAQSPSFRFSGTEMLRSSLTITPNSNFTAVVAFRPNLVGRRMTLFQIGSRNPTGALLDTDGRIVLFSGGKSVKGTQRWSASDTGVVSLVWSGTRARLYVNGTLDASFIPGGSGAASGAVSIGARAVGQDGFRGDFVGLAIYGKTLDDAQRRTVENHYAIPTATPLDASYVSTRVSISGRGLLASDPVASLQEALNARALDGGQILVDSTEGRPIEGEHDIVSEAPLAIRGVRGNRWYMRTATEIEGGWRRDSDGAYSRSDNSNIFLVAYVPNLKDRLGRPVVLTPPYEGRPLHPAGMERVNRRLRVRLPGDANPNNYTILQSRQTSCLRVQNGSGMLTIENGVFRGGYVASIQVGQPDRKGNLTAIDCLAEYGSSGFRGGGQLTSLNLFRCVGRLTANDGFSMKGYDGIRSIMRLDSCEGSENWEEGASPHNDTSIVAENCIFRDNGESGMMAINRSRFEAKNCLFEHNNLRRADEDEGGASYVESAKGLLTGSTFRNNLGAGYYRRSRGNVPISGNTSVGNARSDR